MLNSHEADPCCGDALSEALRSGALDDAESWTHEECGMEWKPRFTSQRIEGWDAVTIRHWVPVPLVVIV